MKEECFFRRKNVLIFLELHPYQIGKAQNQPVVADHPVVVQLNKIKVKISK